MVERKSGIESIGVFSPNQIKSAIGNKGTWSRTDNNITATDHSVDITEMIQAIRRERLSRRITEIVKAAHIKTYEREIGGKMVTVHEHEDSRQKWTGGEGGIHLKRVGEGKESKWVTHEGKEIPEHAKKLVIPPAWKNVRVAPDASHDLQAIGEDAKDRVQRIYSEDATQRAANEKFSRNKELLEKQEKIFRQNEANRKNDVMSIRNHADCMKLIQETGIRPGSDADTGAEKKAYGATTLEGRHVIIEGDKVRLQFVGKKGVNLDIPVDDADTASMLKELKKAAGDNGKLFSVTDATLRDYSHTLDGGSFKPKDFRTLKGTNTAIEEIAKIKEPAKTLKDYKKMVMAIAKKVSEKLGNTPTIALQSYINPFVFESIKPA
jgi:DNA topoisomerase IB